MRGFFVKTRRLILASACLYALATVSRVYAAEGIDRITLEFVEQDIHEILYAVSLYSRIPIAADDTVSGKMSFRFAGAKFESAFDSFLRQARLYVQKETDVWTVSRVRIQKISGAVSAVSVDAYDTPPASILEKIAIECGAPLSWQALPSAPVSVHTGFLPLSAAIAAVVRQFPVGAGSSFTVREDNSRYFIEQEREVFSPLQTVGGGSIQITALYDESGESDSFAVDISRARFFDVTEKLFAIGEKKFCFAAETDGVITRALFEGKSFDETVRLLGSQAGMEAITQDDIYFFVPIRDKSSLMSNSGKKWRKFETNYITPETLASGLSARFSQLETISLAGKSLLCLTNESERQAVLAFIAEIDLPAPRRLVTLRYVTVDFLLKNLPPDIDSRLIAKTGAAGSFFFTGSDAQYEILSGALDAIDSPQPQIRYDILIVQFQETKDTSWKTSFTAAAVKPGDRNLVAAQLGSVLNLNLDVVSVFGITFAAQLQSAISENMASVFADTTLHGISGETISFKNTNTYRYRDVAIDPETGKPLYTGVTREITAGLVLDVTGSVSGDGMITSKVTAQVSRRGADVTSTTGNPPPTSEKSIMTEVRGRSGEPIILSGLVQDDSTIVTERMPLISRIPLIGWFFKSQTATNEKTEMVVYLVPHVVRDSLDNVLARENSEQKCARIFDQYITRAKP
ncbi:MAG: hypothetical protein Pg6C_14010 [Treponemataceae bacterium]|nr:MAG: hypothetical protein Pg6C_14010 [Treponemataceae bacterium]